MVEDIAIGAGDLGFDFWAGMIGHKVANCSPRLCHILGAALPRRRDGPATRCAIRHNTTSAMEILQKLGFSVLPFNT